MKIEFVYLSDFSACAFITEAAHLSLFIVVTRSLVPHIHFSPIKKPPSIATGGLLKTFDVSVTSSAITLQEAKTILAAFSNALNKHVMFNCVVHFVSFPCLLFSLLYYLYTVI